jgi:hypothetical protein
MQENEHLYENDIFERVIKEVLKKGTVVDIIESRVILINCERQ